MTNYSIYIHLPFCLERCPYCDFFSSVEHPIPFRRYREAVHREWEWRSEPGKQVDVVSIYIGGGTPSLWPADELLHLIEPFSCESGTEVTVEVNPGDADAEWFRSLVRHGVNRFSIGAQALDDRRLEWLGRRHTLRDAERAFEWAVLAGAQSINGDLIYGSPGMTLSSLETELKLLAGFGIHHVSAYELTLAKGTPLSTRLATTGEQLPGDDLLAEFWHRAGRSLASCGFSRYEVSNYALSGHQCRHNRHYWRSGLYFGLGAGAHGFLETRDARIARYANVKNLHLYLGFFDSFPLVGACCGAYNGHSEEISPLIRARERMMLGLRTAEGVRGFENLLGRLPEEIQEKWMREVDYCERIGLVETRPDGLVPTSLGMLHADSVAERFF